MRFIKLLFITLIGVISLASADPIVSIPSPSQNVVEGEASTIVTFKISECAIKKEIVVTYENSGDSSTDTITFYPGIGCIQSLDVAVTVPNEPVGYSFDINIIDVDGDSSELPTISPDKNSTLITIIEPPSNTPIVSISPITKNIKIGDSTVDLYIVIDECPNKEDINVTYVNEANTSNTGVVTYKADDTTGSICTLSKPITITVPSDLNISDSFDVNISASISGDQEIGTVSPDKSTISILETISDLNITKTSSKDIVVINEEFTYYIDVSNNGPDESNATSVVDQLPSGLDINITATNSENIQWTCSESGTTEGLVICTHNVNVDTGSDGIPVGETHVVVLKVKAPSIAGYITNTATVSSGNDGDILNNEGSVAIEVVDTGTATDLCYYNSIDTTSKLECESVGTLFYGEDCETSVTIININPLITLENISVKKLYEPDRANGTCGGIECTEGSDGYLYDLDTFVPEQNITISDSETYSSAADGSFSEITLEGTYSRDGLEFAGQISACAGGAYATVPTGAVYGHMDIVDVYSYATYTGGSASNTNGDGPGPDLTTKVAAETSMTLDVVYLGDGSSGPVPFYPDDSEARAMSVLLYICEVNASTGDCDRIGPLIQTGTENDAAPTIASATLVPGYANVATTSIALNMPDIAIRNTRIEMHYRDQSNDPTAEEINCYLHSSTGGGLEEVPACMNNENNIEVVFDEAAKERCTDLWFKTGSTTSKYGACTSSYGGGNTPFHEPYLYEPVCLSCLLDADPTSLSVDAFAIRPKEFILGSSVVQADGALTDSLDQSGVHPVDGPDKLRSGEDYNLTVVALDYSGVSTVDYDQSTDQLNPLTVHMLSDLSLDTTNLLADVNISYPTTVTQFVDGNTSNYMIRYDEVGVIDLNLTDTNWASVDSDDTPVGDYVHFDGTTRSGLAILATSGLMRLTVKPFDFDVSLENVFDNDNSSGFTYLSNDSNMSASLPITINARNKSGGITQNYGDSTVGLYEQLIDFNLTIDSSAYPITLTLLPDLVLSNVDLPFINGTAVVDEDDENVTKINFDRATDNPVNPFRINGADINLSITDIDEVKGDVNGTFLGDATFVYGRVHMPRTRAMCDGTGSCPGNMTFYYEFYGNKNAPDYNATLISDLLGTPAPRSLDSVNWYRNTLHNTANGDGNVTASLYNIDLGGVVPVYSQNGATSSAVYNYTGSKGYPYKGTVTVPLSPPATGGTQSWLIYDKYKPDPATEVRGELEYYGPGKWSSDTGAVESVDDTGTEKNRNTNRRIRW